VTREKVAENEINKMGRKKKAVKEKLYCDGEKRRVWGIIN
jgi:hypothetical protein